ncbi:MAG: creatininase family protein [Burkholderiaceae bacterium]
MIAPSPHAYWQHLGRDDVAALDPSDSVALLPVSAIEQHGPHLPLGTDALISAGVIRAMLPLVRPPARVLVLPALEIGDSLEHTNHPGTLSSDVGTLLELWLQVGAGVAAAGLRKLIIFNTHGGQKPHVDLAAVRLRAAHGLLVVRANSGALGKPEGLFDPQEREFGLHGGDVETSLLLHLHPQLVRMERATDFVSHGQALASAGGPLGIEKPVGIGWMAEDLHPEGVCGNASVASADKGARLLEHMARALARVCEQAAATDWPPGPRGAARSRPEYG